MAKLRADISALLVIAFVFQLVWPIAALATEATSDDYEAALRNNICQVILDETQDNPVDELSNILCDWCVVNCGAAFYLPEAVTGTLFVQHATLLQKPFWADAILPTQNRTYLSAPRAPPFQHF